MRIFVVSLIVVLTGSLLSACSFGDLADMGNQWPDLSDIAAVPAQAAGPEDHEAVINALRAEAEARKSEGYQAPEPSPVVPSDTNNN